LDFLLPLTYSQLNIIDITQVECPQMNIRGVAVRISFLASVEQEIYHAFKLFTVFYLQLPVLSRHIGKMVSGKLVLTLPSCSSVIFRKSSKRSP